MPQYTPTQAKMLAVLADGLPHTSEELAVCIDDLAEAGHVRFHLSKLREKLRPIGQDVLCVLEYPSKKTYRQVRHLLPSSEE